MNILIVDDSKVTREIIKNMIYFNIDRSIIFFEAENGQEAIEILKNNLIDILLTDILMPSMDGYELIKRVKKYITLANTFVVAITGLSGQEHVKKLFESGADYYISKPILKEDIVVRLKLIIKSIAQEKTNQLLVRDTTDTLDTEVMMNYYMVFIISQKHDLYNIVDKIIAVYPQVDKTLLKDFINMLVQSYESLEKELPDSFNINIESSSSALFLTCTDANFIEEIKQYSANISEDYEIVYSTHSMIIKLVYTNS